MQRIDAQLQADATTVAFTAPTDLDIVVDGRAHTLSAGQSWTQPASAAVVVEVPGVLSVRIDPGRAQRSSSPIAMPHNNVWTANWRRRGRRRRGGTGAGCAAPRAHREPHHARRQTRGSALRRGWGSLRARLAELRAVAPDGGEADPEAVAVELTAARDALRDARTHAENLHKVAADAASAQVEKSTAATVLRTRCAVAETEAVAAHEQLATVRAAVTDEALAAGPRRTPRSSGRPTKPWPPSPSVTPPPTRRRSRPNLPPRPEPSTPSPPSGDREARLHTIAAELGVMGSEGRQGQLDDAQAELKRACAEQSRVQERAQAAALLRSTMIRHRDNTRERYVQPYRTELERLGRQVFGPSFEVDVDTGLTIRARTLDGCTVPYESLSGGAKEQLGILARLAGAALVAKEDTVPVVIDDALGFTDPERLTKMGAVFDSVGNHGQVIVLTCMPTRYAGCRMPTSSSSAPERRQSAKARTSSKPATRQSWNSS